LPFIKCDLQRYSEVSTLQSFTTFLSNVYLDVSKDRLYIESPDSAERRACQTVVAAVVERWGSHVEFI
jgi:isoleucyl-tRNA synthetase